MTDKEKIEKLSDVRDEIENLLKKYNELAKSTNSGSRLGLMSADLSDDAVQQLISDGKLTSNPSKEEIREELKNFDFDQYAQSQYFPGWVYFEPFGAEYWFPSDVCW